MKKRTRKKVTSDTEIKKPISSKDSIRKIKTEGLDYNNLDILAALLPKQKDWNEVLTELKERSKDPQYASTLIDFIERTLNLLENNILILNNGNNNPKVTTLLPLITLSIDNEYLKELKLGVLFGLNIFLFGSRQNLYKHGIKNTDIDHKQFSIAKILHVKFHNDNKIHSAVYHENYIIGYLSSPSFLESYLSLSEKIERSLIRYISEHKFFQKSIKDFLKEHINKSDKDHLNNFNVRNKTQVEYLYSKYLSVNNFKLALANNEISVPIITIIHTLSVVSDLLKKIKLENTSDTRIPYLKHAKQHIYITGILNNRIGSMVQQDAQSLTSLVTTYTAFIGYLFGYSENAPESIISSANLLTYSTAKTDEIINIFRDIQQIKIMLEGSNNVIPKQNQRKQQKNLPKKGPGYWDYFQRFFQYFDQKTIFTLLSGAFATLAIYKGIPKAIKAKETFQRTKAIQELMEEISNVFKMGIEYSNTHSPNFSGTIPFLNNKNSQLYVNSEEQAIVFCPQKKSSQSTNATAQSLLANLIRFIVKEIYDLDLTENLSLSNLQSLPPKRVDNIAERTVKILNDISQRYKKAHVAKVECSENSKIDSTINNLTITLKLPSQNTECYREAILSELRFCQAIFPKSNQSQFTFNINSKTVESLEKIISQRKNVFEKNLNLKIEQKQRQENEKQQKKGDEKKRKQEKEEQENKIRQQKLKKEREKLQEEKQERKKREKERKLPERNFQYDYAEDPCTEEGKGLPHEEVSPEISNRETERQKGKDKKANYRHIGKLSKEQEREAVNPPFIKLVYSRKFLIACDLFPVLSELHRRQSSQRFMWPILVVAVDPLLSNFSDFIKISKQVHVQYIFTIRTVKTLNKSILCWLARLNEVKQYVMLLSPLLEMIRLKFWPVVNTYHCWITLGYGNLVKQLRYSLGWKRITCLNQQTFTVIIINNIKRSKLSATC